MTMNNPRRSGERALLAAAKNAQSRSLSSGRRAVRRSTLTWWRRTAFSSSSWADALASAEDSDQPNEQKGRSASAQDAWDATRRSRS